MAERDAALCEIVGREFQGHFVAGQNADVVLAHLAVGVRDEFMTVVKLDTVAGVGQDFQNLAGHFNKVFFCHKSKALQAAFCCRSGSAAYCVCLFVRTDPERGRTALLAPAAFVRRR